MNGRVRGIGGWWALTGEYRKIWSQNSMTASLFIDVS